MTTWGGSVLQPAAGSRLSRAPGRPSLLVLAALLAACATAPAPTLKLAPFVPPLHPFTIEAVKPDPAPACRLDAPPVPKPLGAKPQACPGVFATCLDLPAAAALTEYLEAVQAWSRDAYSRCGVKR